MTRKPLLIVFLVAAVVVLLLLVSGFWRVDADAPALPDVDVTAKGGDLPSVDVDSKEVVVGTSPENVMVPDVDLERRQVDVPTVAVTNKAK